VPDDGKAEIVHGELVLIPPTGAAPGYAADEIFLSLREYARAIGRGRAVGDNKGFVVDPARLSRGLTVVGMTDPATSKEQTTKHDLIATMCDSSLNAPVPLRWPVVYARTAGSSAPASPRSKVRNEGMVTFPGRCRRQ